MENSNYIFNLVRRSKLRQLRKELNITNNNPYITNLDGQNILMYAAKYAKLHYIIEFLLSTKLFDSIINARDKNGYSALQLAVKYRMNNNIRILIKYGALTNILTPSGDTLIDLYCFDLSILKNRIDNDIVRILIKKRSPITMLSLVYLYDIKIISFKHVEWYIANNICDINQIFHECYPYKNYTALHLACSYGLYEICKLLIKYKADINHKAGYFDTPPISRSISPKIDTLLIKNGADLSDVNNYYRSFLSNSIIINAIKQGVTFTKSCFTRTQIEENLNIISYTTRMPYIGLLEGTKEDDNVEEKSHILSYLSQEHNLIEICSYMILFLES